MTEEHYLFDDEYEDDCGWPTCGCSGEGICSTIQPNGTNCPECGDDLVQVQNGDWVCPDCDLWL